MNKDELRELINENREIEFEWKKKKFSITYFYEGNNENDKWISFCEFYKEPIDVKTVDDLCKIEMYGISVLDMLISLSKKDFYIF